MGWFSDACSWVSDRVSDVKDAVVETVSDVAEAVVDGAKAVGRTIECAAQGVVQGVASGVASVGDLAVNVGYNWTTRHAINAFRDEKLESYNSNFADQAAEAVTWTYPQNDYERAVMTTGRVVGEVAGFVAVTVATAGVGGAVVGGGAAAMRTAGATARFLNPLASRAALAIEGGFGTWRAHDLYTTDQQAAQGVEDIYGGAMNDMSDAVEREQRAIQESLKRMQQEIESITDRFENDPDLTLEEIEQLGNRLTELNEGRDIARELRTEITDERREELHEKLEKIDSQINLDGPKPELSDNDGISTSYVRPQGAGVLGDTFARADARSEVYVAGNDPQQDHILRPGVFASAGMAA